MFSSKDSKSQEIIDTLRKTPAHPGDSLFSRRRQPVEIRGETIVFPLEADSTSPEFIQTIRGYQSTIFELI